MPALIKAIPAGMAFFIPWLHNYVEVHNSVYPYAAYL